MSHVKPQRGMVHKRSKHIFNTPPLYKCKYSGHSGDLYPSKYMKNFQYFHQNTNVVGVDHKPCGQWTWQAGGGRGGWSNVHTNNHLSLLFY